MPSFQIEQEYFTARRLHAREGELRFSGDSGRVAFAQELSIERNISFHDLNPRVPFLTKRMVDGLIYSEFTGIYSRILPNHCHRFCGVGSRRCEQVETSVLLFRCKPDLLV